MTISAPTVGTILEGTAATTTSNVPYPAPAGGILANDLLVLAGASGGASATIFTNPSGFTQDGQLACTGNTLTPSAYLGHKFAAGGETGTLAVTTLSNVNSMGMLLLRGVDRNTPLDIAAFTIDQTSASATIALPTQNVITPGSTIVYVISGNVTTDTATPAAGYTEVYDRSLASARSWEVAYTQNVAAGATGAITATWSPTAVRGVGIAIVIRPAITPRRIPVINRSALTRASTF